MAEWVLFAIEFPFWLFIGVVALMLSVGPTWIRHNRASRKSGSSCTTRLSDEHTDVRKVKE